MHIILMKNLKLFKSKKKTVMVYKKLTNANYIES